MAYTAETVGTGKSGARLLSKVSEKIETLEDESKKKLAYKYLGFMDLTDLHPETIRSRMLSTLPLLEGVNDPKAITEGEVMDYFRMLKDSGIKKTTRRTRIGSQIKFFEYIDREDLVKLAKEFKPKISRKEKEANRLAPKDVLKPHEIHEMIKHCKTQRDRTLLMFLWCSGARLGEVTSMKVKNITFTLDGARAYFAEGKTGSREITLLDSPPELIKWINAHPHRDDADSPLFFGYGNEPLSKSYIDRIVRSLRKKAGIKKPVSPHKFRKARATYLAPYFTEFQMCQYFGWVIGSKVVAEYVRPSEDDLHDACERAERGRCERAQV